MAKVTKGHRPTTIERVEGEQATVLNMSLYTSLDSIRDDVVTMSGYRDEDLHEVSLANLKLDLLVNQAWGKKYTITGKVEMYYG